MVYLGSQATEAKVKQLSRSGVLGDARIVHFATHGLLSAETEKLTKTKAEPALLMSPPEKPDENNDGLLTASEISNLKLNADWVILSACNTAGGGRVGAEALSGLARAFFYAGAKSLLVSHWYVDSNATVALITKAFQAIENKPNIGRAEAMRQAMLHLISSGGPAAHPSRWAPFVVVGEGRGAGVSASKVLKRKAASKGRDARVNTKPKVNKKSLPKKKERQRPTPG